MASFEWQRYSKHTLRSYNMNYLIITSHLVGKGYKLCAIIYLIIS